MVDDPGVSMVELMLEQALAMEDERSDRDTE
jgi:hypothetical protein